MAYWLTRKGIWAMGWDPKPTDLRKDYRCNPILLKLDLLGRFRLLQIQNGLPRH